METCEPPSQTVLYSPWWSCGKGHRGWMQTSSKCYITFILFFFCWRNFGKCEIITADGFWRLSWYWLTVLLVSSAASWLLWTFHDCVKSAPLSVTHKGRAVPLRLWGVGCLVLLNSCSICARMSGKSLIAHKQWSLWQTSCAELYVLWPQHPESEERKDTWRLMLRQQMCFCALWNQQVVAAE